MIESTFKIAYPNRLHARPATQLVAKANSFMSRVILSYQGRAVNMKSIMGVLSLGVPNQVVFKIQVDGSDEEACMQALKTLINEINSVDYQTKK